MILAIVIAWLAFADAMATIAGTARPNFALRFAPYAPKALAAQADVTLSANKEQPHQFRLAAALAKRSLEGEAINPRALRLLGYTAGAEGRAEQARTLITLSERLSRREFGTQLWLIEDSVNQNRLREVLHHYDTALRTNSKGGDLLFPILTAALDQPEVQTVLAPYMHRNPPWLYPMLAYAIANSANPATVADAVVQGGGMPAKDDYRELEAALLDKLHSKSNPADIQRYYLSLRDSSPALLQAADFGARQVDPRRIPITWRAIKAAGIEGNFSPTTRNASGSWKLSGYAAPGSSGLIARKLMFLKPGTYQITARVGEMSAPSGSIAKLLLGCYSDGKLSKNWDADFKSKFLTSRFEIRADCPSQYLDVAMSAGEGQNGFMISIQAITINRIQPLLE